MELDRYCLELNKHYVVLELKRYCLELSFWNLIGIVWNLVFGTLVFGTLVFGTCLELKLKLDWNLYITKKIDVIVALIVEGLYFFEPTQK